MRTSTILFGMLALFPISTPATPPALTTRQTDNDNIALYLNGTNFDINYLQTFELSYANTSAYVGRVKYQSYAEALIVGSFSGDDNSVSFLSIHQSPTGFQQMYIVADDSQPVGFSVPHGGPPQGGSTTGFSFGSDGELLHGGINRFYACQNDALAPLNTYQIYWNAAGQPLGWTCQGPIQIQAGDA
jgi:hypothetical protein